jgi:homoserine kinase type II
LDESGAERRYFARIYEEQAESGARFELLLNEALFSASIPVARPLRLRDGSLCTAHDGKPFAMYERLQGEVMCQKGVTPAIARSVGRALAQVHEAPLGTLEVGPSRFGFDGIRARLVRVSSSGRDDLTAAVDRLGELANRLERERPSDLPQGLIHGDLFRDNVLISEEEVAGLLDFESASLGPFVYDLMVTLLAWCFGDGLDPALSRAMVEGYLGVRQLSPEERAAMVIEGSVACLRFATTRLTDFSLRVPAGERPGRDYSRFFERLDALQGGELDAALSGLF